MSKQAQLSKFGNQEEGDGNVPQTQHSETGLKHKTSGAPQQDMPPVGALSLQIGPDSDVQKLKDNPPRRHSASPQRRMTRKAGSHENSAEHSPLHHHHQAAVANKVGGFSPSSEKKVLTEGGPAIAPNTPGRSRLRVSRPDDSPEESYVVPKFADWDEDPSAADAFTGIFKKVSEEKQTSASKVPMIIDDSVYLNRYHHNNGGNNKSSKFCCFNWGKK